MDAHLNTTFHVLCDQLPLEANQKEVVRFAIILEVSNYEILSWSKLSNEQAKQAIEYMRKQINRLNKKALSSKTQVTSN